MLGDESETIKVNLKKKKIGENLPLVKIKNDTESASEKSFINSVEDEKENVIFDRYIEKNIYFAIWTFGSLVFLFLCCLTLRLVGKYKNRK